MGEGADAARGPSLKGRFAAAIALAIGFYLLVLVIGGGLLTAAVLMVVTGTFNLWAFLTCVVIGGSVLLSAVPHRLPFEDPGVRIDASSQPRLVALIEQEAAAMGEDPPDEIFATMEVNASVAQVGRKRMMMIGLPLLQLLSERGFRGVAAHELGHYAGGDTRFGAWIFRTREAIGGTIDWFTEDPGEEESVSQEMTRRLVRWPFLVYGRAFLRVTAAIKRRQEFAADAWAARHAGRDAYVGALRRLHAIGPLFDGYWQEDVVPVLRSGGRPPLSAGFARLAAEDGIQQAATGFLERDLAEGRTGAYDSHPSLSERLAALESLPAGEPDDSGSAAGLVQDLAGLEREMAADLFGRDAAAELSPLDWDDVAETVYVPFYERLVSEFRWLVEDVTFATVPDAIGRMRELLPRLQREHDDLSAAEARDLIAATLGGAGVLALRDDGWTVSAVPGRPVECVRGELVVVPHSAVSAARQDDFDRERYDREIAELGIGGVCLARGVPAVEAGPAAAAGAPAEPVPAAPSR